MAWGGVREQESAASTAKKLGEGTGAEEGGPVVFQEGRIDGELLCGSARFAGLVEVGPKGKVVAETMSFAELTAESGAEIRAQAETFAA